MKDENYLFSRICIDADLRTGVGHVKKLLSNYPSMHLIKEGTLLSYSIKNDGGPFFTVDFEHSRISITVHSKETPSFYLQETVLRLLSILQIVSENYEVKIRSLYPYLIMVLAAQQLRVTQSKKPIAAICMPDIVLSKRLIALLNENTRINAENRRLLADLRKVLLRTVSVYAASGLSLDEISSELGVDKARVIDAIDRAPDLGQRVVRTGKGSFNIVRI